MSSWIKLHRKIIYNPIFKNSELFQLYSYCLLRAGYEENEVFEGDNIIKLEKGQFVTGRNKLSEALGQNSSTIYKRLKKLEKLGYIELKSNNKNTLITVANWELYQVKEQQSNNKVTTKEQQSNTNKNSKNKKEDIMCDFFESIWKLYPEKKGKSKVNKKSIKELEKLGYDKVKEIIEIYKKNKPEWQQFQNGSTFFNGGYVDYIKITEEPKKILQPIKIEFYDREY